MPARDRNPAGPLLGIAVGGLALVLELALILTPAVPGRSDTTTLSIRTSGERIAGASADGDEPDEPQVLADAGPEDEAADASGIGAPTVAWRGTAPWQIRTPSSASRLTQAYADAPSYLAGQTLGLAVSTTSLSYSVSIWRLGGSIQRMFQSAMQRGLRQTATARYTQTGLVRADWKVTFQFQLPSTWPSGIYLARIASTGGSETYVKFVIRAASASQLLFVDNVLTEAAYNRWGGASLYTSTFQTPDLPVAHGIQVSLDRPNLLENGAGLVFLSELPLSAWLERQGFGVSYTTDWDLSRDPSAQPIPAAIIFSGHSEYWSGDLRSWLDRLVLDRGEMSLGLFGSNSGYWPVDLSADGRTISCYKEVVTQPGYSGPTLRQDGSARTLRFRDLPIGDRDSRNWPEQSLFGIQYGSLSAGYVPYLLGDAVPAELLVDTDLPPGVSIGTLAGGETDVIDPAYFAPPEQAVVARAPGFIDRYGRPAGAAAVFRKDPSGARVFAAGTPWWIWGLDPAFAATHAVPAGFAQLTRNIVGALGT